MCIRRGGALVSAVRAVHSTTGSGVMVRAPAQDRMIWCRTSCRVTLKVDTDQKRKAFNPEVEVDVGVRRVIVLLRE